MNLSSIKDVVTSKVARQFLLGQKHSPVILFGTGVVGVVATVVLASRSTLNLDHVIDETNDKLCKAYDLHETGNPKYSDRDWQQDKAVIYVRGAMAIAKLYWPAVTIGVISITCLTGSHIILTKRNIGLTAAYAAVEKGFAEYRARVLTEVGEDKERELRYGSETREILEETDKGEPKTKMVSRVGPNGASVYARFFDEYSSSWQRNPEYNRMFLQCQQDWANDRLRARGHVFLNEVYDSLGIDRSKEGAVVGWRMTKDGIGDNFVDFGMYNADSERARAFVNGREGSILLDFNVDGTIFDKI
jgi:hypothetical protein